MSTLAGSTGPHAAQPGVLRSRPSVAAGVALLLAGVVLGGLGGVGVRARQGALSRAAPRGATAAAVAPPPVTTAAAPYAGVPFGSLVLSEPAPSATTTVAKPSKPPRGAKTIAPNPKEKDEVASAAPEKKAAKPRAEPKKAAEKPPPKKLAQKAEPKKPEAKKPEPKKVEKPARARVPDDAASVLRAARGATENTL